MGVGLVRNHVINYIRRWCRSASRHPLMVFMIFVVIWTYLWFPLLFSLLVYASPVIASTLVLLGTLLFYGHANAPQVQKRETSDHHEIHNLVFGGMGNTEFDEETYLVHNKFGSSIDSCVSRKQEAKSELGNRRPVLANRGAQFPPFGTGNPQSRSSDGSRRTSFDPSNSVLGHIDDDNKGTWDSGSDASMADNFPMLDEHLPLLESGDIINETDDDDVDDDHYGHEDIDVKDDDDDEDGTVITWTEDDQRNLMNMGTLELVRNQRLESLVARQKAIKNMRMMAEKNMVNISPDFRIIDTHISTGRNTIFDLPNHSHENILGSAPSNMLPRRYSLDLPYDLRGAKPDRLGPTFQSGSVALQSNHPLANRRKSFDVGIVGHSTLDPYSLPKTKRIGSDTESIGSTRTSNTNEHIIPRSRLPKNGDSMKLHHAAQGDNTSNEVKTVTGYEDKTSKKSSSSSFCDVTDDINDGDDDNEEEEFGSIPNSPTPDAKDLQDLEASGDSDSDSDSESEAEEAGLTQRLKSWFTGWKA